MFFSLTSSKLFLTKTIDQLISGYSDPLIKMASIFERDKLKDGKFSLLLGVNFFLCLNSINFYVKNNYVMQKNGTNWQNFTIMTGIDNVMDVGKVLNWNGLE